MRQSQRAFNLPFQIEVKMRQSSHKAGFLLHLKFEFTSQETIPPHSDSSGNVMVQHLETEHLGLLRVYCLCGRRQKQIRTHHKSPIFHS